MKSPYYSRSTPEHLPAPPASTSASQHKTLRRSRLEIVLDLLTVISEGAQKKTWIMQQCNISWGVLVDLLTELEEKKLVVRDFAPRSRDTIYTGTDIDRTRYSLTPQGFESLSLYKHLAAGIGIPFQSTRLARVSPSF